MTPAISPIVRKIIEAANAYAGRRPYFEAADVELRASFNDRGTPKWIAGLRSESLGVNWGGVGKEPAEALEDLALQIRSATEHRARSRARDPRPSRFYVA